jgi:hypothetical protein
MRDICLYNLEQAGLILLENNDCLFFNQVGGADCRRREAMGLFVPISNDPMLESERYEHLDALLAQATRGVQQLTGREATAIDDVLMSLSSTDLLSVDRKRLSDSEPGWVFVQLVPTGEYTQFPSMPAGPAVLTWPNKLNFS